MKGIGIIHNYGAPHILQWPNYLYIYLLYYILWSKSTN